MRYIKIVCIIFIFSSCVGIGPVTSIIKRDPITNRTTITTSKVSLQNSMTDQLGMPQILLSGIKGESYRVLVLDIRVVGAITGYINESGKLQLKTSNDKIFELKSMYSSTPSYSVGNYGITTWSIVAYYSLPESIYQELINMSIIFIRVHLNEGYLDRPIVEKFDNRIKEVLTVLK